MIRYALGVNQSAVRRCSDDLVFFCVRDTSTFMIFVKPVIVNSLLIEPQLALAHELPEDGVNLPSARRRSRVRRSRY